MILLTFWQKKIGIDTSPEKFSLDLPHQKPMDRIFNPSFMLKNGSVQKASYLTSQVLFTASPYVYDGKDIDQSQSAEDLRQIVTPYMQAIEQLFPCLRFGDNLYADSKKQGVDFRYLISPYDPAQCHPNDIGKPMPLKLFDGITINIDKRLTLPKRLTF